MAMKLEYYDALDYDYAFMRWFSLLAQPSLIGIDFDTRTALLRLGEKNLFEKLEPVPLQL